MASYQENSMTLVKSLLLHHGFWRWRNFHNLNSSFKTQALVFSTFFDSYSWVHEKNIFAMFLSLRHGSLTDQLYLLWKIIFMDFGLLKLGLDWRKKILVVVLSKIIDLCLPLIYLESWRISEYHFIDLNISISFVWNSSEF